jgi:hypothetical protein
MLFRSIFNQDKEKALKAAAEEKIKVVKRKWFCHYSGNVFF